MHNDIVLVTGATGKTGRRVAASLRALDIPVREASRSSATRFDWADPASWAAALEGVESAFLVLPHLGSPTATEHMEAFVRQGVESGLRRAVLISQPLTAHLDQQHVITTERALTSAGLGVTTIRPRWFFQNFTEDFLTDAVVSGDLRLPAGHGREAFVDADDIAGVAVAALRSREHDGQDYNVSGPGLLGFAEIADELSQALSRQITYTPLTREEFRSEQLQARVPAEWVELSLQLYQHIASGELETITDDVERVLGRAPRDFRGFADHAATTGVWATGDSTRGATQ